MRKLISIITIFAICVGVLAPLSGCSLGGSKEVRIPLKPANPNEPAGPNPAMNPLGTLKQQTQQKPAQQPSQQP